MHMKCVWSFSACMALELFRLFFAWLMSCYLFTWGHRADELSAVGFSSRWLFWFPRHKKRANMLCNISKHGDQAQGSSHEKRFSRVLVVSWRVGG